MPYRRSEIYQPPPSAGMESQVRLHAGLADALNSFEATVDRVGTPIMADLGARAGSKAGANREGGTRLPVGPYNRAYNEAFLRSYTLDVYADVEQDFIRMEADSKGDPQAFAAAATARRDAIMEKTLPEASAYIQKTIDERLNSGVARLTSQAVERDWQTQREKSMRGLDAIRRRASTGYTAGTEDGLKIGNQAALEYAGFIDSGVADGTFTPAEGQKLIEAGLKANASDLVIADYEREANTPGGNPLKVIRTVLESDNPAFDDEARQALAGEMMRRMNRDLALAKAEQSGETADLLAARELNEAEGTARLFKGTLTVGWLTQKVERREIDPAVARTLRNAMQERGGEAEDDPMQVFDLSVNWRQKTTAEVLATPGLSWSTKQKYAEKIATREADWRDSDEYQAGRERIATAARVSLQDFGAASSDAQTKARAGLIAYDTQLDAVPPDQRIAKSIEIADRVVAEVVEGQAMKQIEQLTRARDRAITRAMDEANADSIDDLSASEREALNAKLKQMDAAIDKAKGAVRGK